MLRGHDAGARRVISVVRAEPCAIRLAIVQSAVAFSRRYGYGIVRG